MFSNLQQKMRNKKQRGAAAIEYALIAALIALAIVAGLTALGGNLEAVFDSIAQKLTVSAPSGQ